jgi:hypothetical protein
MICHLQRQLSHKTRASPGDVVSLWRTAPVDFIVLDRKLTIYVYKVLLFVAQFSIRCLQRVAAMGLPTPRSTLQRIIVDRYSAVIPR